jgi:hypothetical protein
MSLRVLLPGSTIPSKLLKVVPTQLGSEVVLELGGSECRSLSNDFEKTDLGELLRLRDK